MPIGKTMLGRRHVLPSVVSTLTELMVEGTFPNGTYLVTIHHPISSDDGDLEKALYGSFLPIPSKDAFPPSDPSEYETEKAPGAVIPVKEGKIVLNEGRKRIRLKITSKGDRPIQVLTAFRGWNFAHFAQLLLGRITLPPHRDESPTGLRSDQGIWL
jgi:urease